MPAPPYPAGTPFAPPEKPPGATETGPGAGTRHDRPAHRALPPCTGRRGTPQGRTRESLEFAIRIGFTQVWTEDTLPDVPFHAVVDASNASKLPSLAVAIVEPVGRIVYIGLAGAPSLMDTHSLALNDITAVGILSASPVIEETVAAYAEGRVDPRL